MCLFDRLNALIVERLGPNMKFDESSPSVARTLCEAIEEHIEERVRELLIEADQ